MSKPIDPQSALEAMHKTAPFYAEARGNRVMLEEYRKSLKATLMKASGETTLAAQEREAYAHPSYIEHLKGLQAAVEQEEKLRWRLVTAQAAIEVWRSQEASNRAMDRAAS